MRLLNPTAKRDVMGIFSRRAFVLGGVGAVTVGAIGARLVYLQTFDPTDYEEEAANNRFDQRPIVPPRGVIYDRFGTALAITSPDYRVTISRERAGKNYEALVREVGAIIGLSEDQMLRRLQAVRTARKFDDVLIRQGLTWDQFAALNVRLPELPGVTAEVGQQRFYPYTLAFAHPLGYVQRASPREVERVEAEERAAAGLPAKSRPGERFESLQARYLRHPDVRVGKAGLEASLERGLRGDAGIQLVEVNATGRVVSEVRRESRKPRNGDDTVLTLDADIQRYAMERMSGESASCLVMDIWEGDLIVMASSPGFDPNQFINGISGPAFKALNEDPYKPLFHKAVTGSYKPGSTFKVVTGLAAVKEGMEPTFRVNCPGFFVFGGRAFHCWKRGGHGTVDLHSAMKGSCNVFFYNAALRAGPARIAEVARLLGFQQKFDIGVPAVTEGQVPDPQWWRKQKGEDWPPGATLNTGIGQGDLLTTPLQLVTMTARVANGGKGVIPRLIRDGAGAKEPTRAVDLGIAGPALERIVAGLYGVCNEPGGTALTAGRLDLVRDPATNRIVEARPDLAGAIPVQMAGKTGTAQVRVITAGERASGVKRNEDLPWGMRDHALFICYAPFDAPRYACAVVVEHGGGGSRVAAPIARDVMRMVLLNDPSAKPSKTLAQAPSGGDPA